MERIRYKISAKKLQGCIIITYVNGILKSVINEFKPALNNTQWYHIISLLPIGHADFNIPAFEAINLIVDVNPADAPEATPETTEAEPTTFNRVAIFCSYYKNKFGINYSASRVDGAKLKACPVSDTNFEALIKTYFASEEWYLSTKSIANFVGKINEIKLLMANPSALAKKANWPIPFDAGYNNTLTDDKRALYYAALRDAGYRYKDNPGRGGKWEKVL